MLRAVVRDGMLVIDGGHALREGDVFVVIPLAARDGGEGVARRSAYGQAAAALAATIQDTLAATRQLTRALVGEDRDPGLCTVEIIAGDERPVRVPRDAHLRRR